MVSNGRSSPRGRRLIQAIVGTSTSSIDFVKNTDRAAVFHSFHELMNSINWPASSVWVFIGQLVEHCSANAEATGSNPVVEPKNFFSAYFAIA